ncbi:MAG: UDP-N-acetylmuramoyl-L-alanyl-D-glutamate--2,6-diaminopimelate ligase [Candidatus Planktophila sp.]|nr:UDP-N-acetylmuramoyl-L-alanyl-D-glutamate--2,6-diaminopimelate ligase [Candidatus Planktophila sp.]
MQRPLNNSNKNLASILSLVGATSTLNQGELSAVEITGVSQASSSIVAGDIFVALPGEKYHGADFAIDAIAKGAVAVLSDAVGASKISGVPVLISSNPRRSAGVLSAWFYGEPMRDLYSIGVTGTNGKTTVTTLLHQIMQAVGRESGLIGTVEVRIGSEALLSKRTTPESSELQALCALMRERHMHNIIMEVSSHAISLERVRGSHFAVVGFTNLSQDHLDFHKSMESYFKVKAELFTFEFADLAVINIDDQYGARLADLTQLPVITLSRSNSKASWHYTSITRDYVGASVSIRGSGGILIEGKTCLYGGFNYDNLLMAVAIAVESGVDPIDVAAIIPILTGAKGRLEAVRLGQKFTALVDYAHSPDAVARVLETAHDISDGNVIAVLGCGGDRDRSKRSLMGMALRNGADVAIFTSDNPRSEDPEVILEQMTENIEILAPNQVISDRTLAIKTAVNHAKTGDVVIILGKGHEMGQEINGVIHAFDDRIELARAIEDKR